MPFSRADQPPDNRALHKEFPFHKNGKPQVSAQDTVRKEQYDLRLEEIRIQNELTRKQEQFDHAVLFFSTLGIVFLIIAIFLQKYFSKIVTWLRRLPYSIYQNMVGVLAKILNLKDAISRDVEHQRKRK